MNRISKVAGNSRVCRAGGQAIGRIREPENCIQLRDASMKLSGLRAPEFNRA